MPYAVIYVVIGATIGATLVFLIAQTALGNVFREKAGHRLHKMREGFQKNAWSYLLFLRLIPLFPFWLVNIAPAFFGVSTRTYIWTTCLGIVPGTYAYVQAGHGLDSIFSEGKSFSLENVLNREMQIALVLLAVFALTPIFIKKILQKRKDHD